MSSKFKVIIAFFAVTILFFVSACTQSINSPEALKEYLDKQPANTPYKPIKVTMSVNDLSIGKICGVLNSAGKFVSLNLSGNALTTIPNWAFCEIFYRFDEREIIECATLTAITIPKSVTSIGECAFIGCKNLASVTIPDSVKVALNNSIG